MDAAELKGKVDFGIITIREDEFEAVLQRFPGKVGVVEMCHGCHMFPDSVATDRGDNPQWLYTVVFDARELWGDDADPTLKVSIDAFEPYLEAA